MVLAATGPLSFTQLQTEFGGTNPISMSEYYTNATPSYTNGVAGIPAMGSLISVSHFSGKAKPQSILYSFTTFTFTNAGVTGQNGPTLANCTSSYSSASWASNTSYFNVTTQGIQKWTVPKSGSYTITVTVAGAAGGTATWNNTVGGAGRVVSCTVTLSVNDYLYIIVGQKGVDNQFQAGGGGGSYVYYNSISASGDSFLLAAGGGGGSTHTRAGKVGESATAGSAGNNGLGTTSRTGGSGGSNGSGGTGGGPNGQNGSAGLGGNGGIFASSLQGGGGGGGGLGTSSSTFVGGTGGTNQVAGGNGGFGGGGGGGSGNGGGGAGGGGGGYSGGGGAGMSYTDAGSGGGGGSASGTIITVSNYNSNVGTNSGHGYVTVTAN